MPFPRLRRRARRRTERATKFRSQLEVLEQRLPLASWIPQGPAPTINSQLENVVPDNEVSGAIHTLVAHPTNPNELYVGAVNGGIWKTSNAQFSRPLWTPLTDEMPSLSIGALVYDTTDPTLQTLVAGIGHFSSFGRRGGELTGLLRTSDGGSTWEPLGQADLSGRSVSGVVAQGEILVVSANRFGSGTLGGVYRSSDGGANFEGISGNNGLPIGAAYDVVADPTNPDRLYVAVGEAGLFRSDDTGVTWTDVSTNDQSAAGLYETITTFGNNNTEMSVAGNGRIYVGVAIDGQARYIGYSDNLGQNWIRMDLPQTPESNGDVEGLNPRVKPGGQGAIHFSILADASNPNLVYVGGDRQDGPYPNFIGATGPSGRLFRGNTGVAATGAVPSPQWQHLTHRSDIGAIPGGGTASRSAPHADSREMAFDALGNLVQVDDGGIYRRTNPQTNNGDWFSINGNLAVTEIHDIAYDSNTNTIVAGTQDTGTVHQAVPGATVWDTVSGGDGGDIAVDDRSTPSFSTRYTSSQDLIAFRRRVYDANNQLISTASPALTVIGGGSPLEPSFVTPVELNGVDPNRLIIGGENSVYESLDQGETLTEIGPGILVNRVALAYGGRKDGAANPDVLYVGSEVEVYARLSAGTPLQPTQFPGRLVRDIALHPNDWMTAFAIDHHQVFGTTDGGATWSNVTGNLVDASLRALDIITGSVERLIVGGLGGIFAMSLERPGIWGRLGDDLPNTPVYDLEYDEADDVIVTGTQGRGAFLLRNAASESAVVHPSIVVQSASPTPTVSEDGRSVTFDVFLTTQPVETVSIPLASLDPSEVAIDKSELVFTTANWFVPQTVTLAGIDDSEQDNDARVAINIGPATSTTASDGDYHELDPDDLIVVNLDDEISTPLFWVDHNTDRIQRLSGGSTQTIVDLKTSIGAVAGDLAPRYLDIDANARKIYWTDSEQGAIYRADLTGTNVEQVIGGQDEVRGVALGGGKIYWVDRGLEEVRRANLDGSQVETIISHLLGGAAELELDLNAGRIYWTENETAALEWANLDGSNSDAFTFGAGSEPTGLELDTDNGRFYWSDLKDERIYRGNLDGTSDELLVELHDLVGPAGVAGLTLDRVNDKLYWSDLATGSIYRANSDGTNVAEVVSGLGAPHGLAIVQLEPGVSPIAAGDMLTSESGDAVAISVTLDAPPLDTVVVPVAVDNQAEAQVSPTSLTFTTENWDLAQVVTVVGLDDSVRDGDVGYNIIFGPPQGNDSRYTSLAPVTLTATNWDNEFDISSDLTHYWKFDETSGLLARDSAGGNDARLVNWGPAEPTWVNGRIGGALDFGDANNYAQTARKIEQEQYTVSFWLRVQDRGGINPRIIEPMDGLGIVINDQGGQGVGVDPRFSGLRDANPPQLLSWEHYAVMLDHRTGQGQVFRDGQRVAAGTFTPGLPQLPWVMGHNASLGNQNDPLDGLLDDLRIYDRILMPADVRALGRENVFLAINDVEVNEGNAGNTTATLTVSLSAPVSSTVIVDFSTADGTASAGSDYVAAGGQLEFAANETQKTIEVSVIGDLANEGDERFFVELSTLSTDVVLLGSGAVTILDDEADVNTGLRHHWKFDETSGDIAADSVGGNHARLFNWGPSEDRWIPGRIGGALDFGDVNNFARTTTGIVQTQYTISFWVNVRQQFGINPRIVEPIDGLAVVINNQLGAGIGVDPRFSGLRDPNPPQLFEWEHYAVTLDHTTGIGRVYRDGQEAASGTFTPDIPQLQWVFGHFQDPSNQNDPLSGWLDDLRIYDRILSAVDIRELGTESPFLSINDVTVVEGDSGTRDAVFTVSLSPAASVPVTVDFVTADGSAIGNTDYLPAAGQLTFAPGQTQQSIVVPIVGDLAIEGDERFFVDLSGPQNAVLVVPRGVATIQDDEVNLNNGLRHHWKFDETEGDRAHDSVGDNDIVLVNWGPSEPQWVAGRLGGALDFGNSDNLGVTESGIEMPQYTISFWMRVTRQSGVNARIVAPVDGFHITILTDFSGGGVGFFEIGDPAPPQLLTWEHYVVTVDHISTAVQVFRDGALVASGNVTAPIPRERWFIGHTTNFRFHNDSIDARLDDLRVYDRVLSGVDVRALGTNSRFVSVNDAAILEGDNGTRSAVFTVSLSPAATENVTVDYATLGGSATSGVDYTSAAGQLIFAPGESQKQIAVDVIGDAESDGDETFVLELQAAAGAVVAVNRGYGTILDDDGDISTGLVHHWKFDETAGDLARDSAGNNDLELLNWGPSETQWVPGRLGGALDFGDSDNLGLTESGIELPQYSISFWMKLTRESGVNARIVAPEDGYHVNILTDFSGGGVGFFEVGDIVPPRLLTWEHYAVTVDHLSTEVQVFRDSILVARGNVDAPIPELPWYIGHSNSTQFHNDSIDGLLDDLRVFDRLLTPTDVREMGLDVPYLSINDVVIDEGDSGTSNATFAVSLSPAVPEPVTVQFSSTGGTATSGTDFQPAGGQLNFQPNETEKTITVPIVGDLAFEGDESFFVDIFDASGATLAAGRGVAVIRDNELPPTVTLSLAPIQIPETGGAATVIAELSEVAVSDVTVQLGFTGTAVLGADYSASATALVIPAGSQSASLNVLAIEDTLDESDETVVIDIETVTGALESGTQQQTLTIIDDDTTVPQVSLSVDNMSIPEGGGVATVLVTLSSSASQTVLVDLGFTGSATRGVDYNASSAQVVIPPGSLVGASAIVAVQDSLDENDETVTIEIIGVTNALENGTQSQSITIVDDDETDAFVVTSLTPTATGFVARFDADLDSSELNLYDTQTAGLGPADAVLTGAASGPVAGSLVVDADSRQVTFVKTNGPLAADSYTVVLRSAANAFKNDSGELLDGDRDGAAGGDFSSSFEVVQPPGARVVGLPNFTRGPGQAVDVPANGSGGLPVNLSDGAGVASVDLRVAYDPALLTINSASVGETMPVGATVAVNSTTPGLLILSFFSSTPLQPGNATILNLAASVPTANASEIFLAQQILDIHSLTVSDADDNELPAVDDDAVHVVGYFGDPSGNGRINASDASRIARIGVLLDSGFSPTPLTDPIIVGDISGNGRINASDAAKVAQAGVLLPVPEIPPIPAGVLGFAFSAGFDTRTLAKHAAASDSPPDSPPSAAIELIRPTGTTLDAGFVNAGNADWRVRLDRVERDEFGRASIDTVVGTDELLEDVLDSSNW